MALLKVAHLGHPVLRQIADAVPPAALASDALQRFIDDLVLTMREYDGVGLAAPQVHESLRIVAYEIAGNPRYPAAPSTSLTVLVNPVLTPETEEQKEDWEGCLSLPDLRGLVPRFTRIRVEALDRAGQPLSFVANDFHARVIQHECDHLDGHVFLDRMPNLSSLSFLDEFVRYAVSDESTTDDTSTPETPTE